MKVLVFQDDEKMPLPRLMKMYLRSAVEFAEGANNLKSKIDAYYWMM